MLRLEVLAHRIRNTCTLRHLVEVKTRPVTCDELSVNSARMLWNSKFGRLEYLCQTSVMSSNMGAICDPDLR